MSYRNITFQKKKDNTYIVFLPCGNIEVVNDVEVYETIDDYLDSQVTE